MKAGMINFNVNMYQECQGQRCTAFTSCSALLCQQKFLRTYKHAFQDS